MTSLTKRPDEALHIGCFDVADCKCEDSGYVETQGLKKAGSGCAL